MKRQSTTKKVSRKDSQLLARQMERDEFKAGVIIRHRGTEYRATEVLTKDGSYYFQTWEGEILPAKECTIPKETISHIDYLEWEADQEPECDYCQRYGSGACYACGADSDHRCCYAPLPPSQNDHPYLMVAANLA